MPEYIDRLPTGTMDYEFTDAFRIFPMQSTGMLHFFFTFDEHPSATTLESL